MVSARTIFLIFKKYSRALVSEVGKLSISEFCSKGDTKSILAFPVGKFKPETRPYSNVNIGIRSARKLVFEKSNQDGNRLGKYLL